MTDLERALAYPDERPPRRPFARAYARLALAVVGRGFCIAQRIDRDFRAEIAALPPGLSFELRVHPFGPSVRLELDREGMLHPARAPAHGAPQSLAPDVLLSFGTMSAALSVLTFSVSAFAVYAKGGLTVSGDLGETMAIIRALGILETILLPGFLARKVLKRPHRMSATRKARERAALYLSLPFAG